MVDRQARKVGARGVTGGLDRETQGGARRAGVVTAGVAQREERGHRGWKQKSDEGGDRCGAVQKKGRGLRRRSWRERVFS